MTCAKELSYSTDRRSTAKSRIRTATEDLEFRIDNLASGVHSLFYVESLVNETVDSILGNTAKALEQRDRGRLESSGTEKIGVGDLLRSFSRIGS